MQYSERTLRRRARNIGYIVRKGFVRTKAIPSTVVDTVSGYTIYNTVNNSGATYMIAGDSELYYNLLTLEDVEQFLREEYKARELVF